MNNTNSKLPVMQKSNKNPLQGSNSLPRSTTYLVESPKSSRAVENTISDGAAAKNVPKKSTLTNNTQNNSNNKVMSPIKKEGTFTKQPTTPQTTSVESPSKKNISLAMLKQQKRAEILKASSQKSQNHDESESDIILTSNRSIESILKNARKSGLLNLSNHGLTEVPNNVWSIDTEKNENNDSEDCKWWDHVNLTKLILVSNRITSIPKNVHLLASLVTLDIHDNQLEFIDEAIGELNMLQFLNISHNQLTSLPENICKLRQLTSLNVSFNKLAHLPKNIGKLDDLEDLDLSNNQIVSIQKSFGWLRKLRKLNLSTNLLKFVLNEVFYSTNLRIIDLSENQIETLPEDVSELGNLDQFFASHNKIKKLPRLTKCCKLKDLDFSFNELTEIDERWFDNLMSLINLNLRDNRIKVLPSTVRHLQSLERLDLTNNDLPGLPCELATIESLKQLLINGNPLRTIRRDIINRGTDAILKSLRNQLQEPLNNSNSDKPEEILKSETIKSSKVLDLSGKKLNEVTASMVSYCKQSTALVLNLSKNILTDLPNEMEMLNNQLNELNIGINLFSSFPRPVLSLSSLSTLDLRGNRLTSLPNEISRLTALRDLIFAENKITEIPPGVYQLPILENLFANNNKITSIDAMKIVKMKHLSTLNLQNNDITQVPLELGLAEQIKSLQLEGNEFRVPRPQILAKGTIAILEYLRGRLSES